MLNSCVQAMGDWGEVCACHGWLNELTETQRERLAQLLKELKLPGFDSLRADCICKGLRAAELAAGELILFFKQLCERGAVQLLLELGAGLSQDEIDRIVNDYNNAVAHIIAVLTNKLQFWAVLPWRLAGLAHFCLETARSIARWAIQSFDAYHILV